MTAQSLVESPSAVTAVAPSTTEAAVRRRLSNVAKRAEAGEFSNSSPLGGPVIYRYPAVMLPEFQRAVLDAVAPAGVSPVRTLDPFVGSGTTMCEATLRGFPFVGVDVNPLAVLISSVKAGPYHLDAFRAAADRVSEFARRTRGTSLIDFPSRDKWYRPEVQLDLTRLRRGIEAEGHLPTRRFLWVALAETARLCSNSRLTTFKLHIRPTDQLERPLQPVHVFDRVVAANLVGFEAWREELLKAQMLKPGGWLASPVELIQGDIRTSGLLPRSDKSKFGLMLTSPPYGDNRSTIPYGEASYLPTQWINPVDLGREGTLENAFTVDAQSLGGSWRGASAAVENLRGRSPAFAAVLKALENQPHDRVKRVASFLRDLDDAITRTDPVMAGGAWQVWTVGSRTVGGTRIPLSSVLIELQAERNVRHVATLTRRLPSQRRAASRNDRAARMDDEQVLVFQSAH